jgi:hypothetical protein
VTGQVRGKRLFAGRLFAGRLFGAPIAAGGVGLRRLRVPRSLVDARRLRQIDEDDVLLLMVGAICSACVPQA